MGRRKKQPGHFTYAYAGQQLTNADEFKYLGVIFPITLKRSNRTYLVCVKALLKLAYLKRALKNSSIPCKITADKNRCASCTWVRFSSMVTFFKCDIAQLESFLERAIMFILRRYYCNFFPTFHAEQLSLRPLSHRCECDRMALVHNIVHGSTRLAVFLS